ncbi:hypothetical protein L6164_028413 [Bauhinia variegata]|uniref:Uncharacterized protein n=1 Tax=Bauhinia variegata TaxID=167791 RepID=A0ACB9L5T8_BAUVA|nr:hypothetical protein L6164_028413 [Bauhinia variegata]
MTLNTNSFMEETRTNFKNQWASIQKLETQIAEQLAERPLGSLPSSTIPNPRGELKAITTRRGTVIEPKPSKTQGKPENTDHHQVIEENDQVENVPTSGPKSRTSCGSPMRKKKNDMEQYNTPKSGVKVPYPQRLQKPTDEKSFSKFLEIFKKTADQYSICRCFGTDAFLC